MLEVISPRNPEGLSPDVSVIIPTYNRISMLEEALASIVSQKFNGIIEIIIIDDNSQDKTSEIISEKYPFIKLISLRENKGAYVARNQGILRARGKYIAFLDSDDLWKSNYLETQISAIKDKEKTFAVSDVIIWETNRNFLYVKLQRPSLDKFTSAIHQLLVSTFIATPSSVLVHRDIFDKIGLFDEDLRVGGDTDFYLRCLALGYKITFTNQPLTIKREHKKNQLTDPKNLKVRERSRLRRINKFYSLSGQNLGVSIRQIQAEVHAFFGNQYLKNNYFYCWLISILLIIYYSSPTYGLSVLKNQIKDLINKSGALKNTIKILTDVA